MAQFKGTSLAWNGKRPSLSASFCSSVHVFLSVGVMYDVFLSVGVMYDVFLSVGVMYVFLSVGVVCGVFVCRCCV